VPSHELLDRLASDFGFDNAALEQPMRCLAKVDCIFIGYGTTKTLCPSG
jgi:hypothetical protein